ncbi:LSU ribosomal protein L14P [Thermoplasmatales archaeon SCGC AB-539-N05]|nr:LSU ribosomal protein L14P [Thermoplasmatales archaeon SCGC AB-539-N05]ENO12177.1 LSU ribosomal protein L14P [Thermoplasmatales archaeon SCGC AB-539-C06]
MKGIAGRSMKGLPVGARLDCVDNTGAKIVEIVMTLKTKGTHRRYPAVGIGDMAIVSVKKGSPDMKRQLLNAVVVRQRRAFRRPDGTMVEFDDNAAVIVTPTGETKGSMIKGPVAIEAAERWPKIASAASMIV